MVNLGAGRFRSVRNGPQPCRTRRDMPARPLVKRLGARALLMVIAVVAGVVATALLAVFGLPYGGSHRAGFAHVYTFPANGNTTHLHIDADITNGSRPCDPIDETATVLVGTVRRVGVCIEDYVPNGIESFELHIRYSGDPDAIPPTTINAAPTTMAIWDPAHGWWCSTPDPKCLNANPDANEGDDPTGFKLGGGWDCTGLAVAPPVGEDPGTPGVADARIVCVADIITPDKDLTANPGLLATIEFTATNAGVDTIDFGPIDANNGNFVGLPRWGGGGADCGTVVPAEQVGCFGVTIHKVAAPVGGIAEIPALVGASAEDAAPGDGWGWSTRNVVALAGGLAAAFLAAAGGAWYTRRRWLG